jgi:hypothetical protein
MRALNTIQVPVDAHIDSDTFERIRQREDAWINAFAPQLLKEAKRPEIVRLLKEKVFPLKNNAKTFRFFPVTDTPV